MDLTEVFIRNVEERMQGRTDYWLAKESGLSSATISRLMGRKMKPAIDTIDAIAKALEVHPSELLIRQKSEKGEVPQDILEMLRDQDPIVYEAVRGLLKPFAKRRRR